MLLTPYLAAIISVLAIPLASDRPRHLSGIAWVRSLRVAVRITILRSG